VNITGPHAEILTFKAEGTISKRYAVKVGTAENGIVVSNATSVSIGILVADSDATTNLHAPVCVHGVCEAICGAAVTAGAALSADSAGKVVTAAGSAYPFAWAMESSTATGEYIKIFVVGPCSVT
jgi:hypothetical protein